MLLPNRFSGQMVLEKTIFEKYKNWLNGFGEENETEKFPTTTTPTTDNGHILIRKAHLTKIYTTVVFHINVDIKKIKENTTPPPHTHKKNIVTIKRERCQIFKNTRVKYSMKWMIIDISVGYLKNK